MSEAPLAIDVGAADKTASGVRGSPARGRRTDLNSGAATASRIPGKSSCTAKQLDFEWVDPNHHTKADTLCLTTNVTRFPYSEISV